MFEKEKTSTVIKRRIKCPKCGAVGTWELASSGNVNDNENFNKFESPEGFRQVQLGWNAEGIYLVCMKCGVPGDPDDKT